MSDSNPPGVLANLTATYTDSDASDDESGKSKTKKTSLLVSYSYIDDADRDEIADEIDDESISYLVAKKEKVTAAPLKEEKLIEDEKIDFRESIASKYEDFDQIMPPEPSERCSPKLQEKIARLYQKKVTEGLDMNALIENRKDLRNPSIYEKLIAFCGIDEYGTNFPKNYAFGPESYYEELAKAQKIEMDKRLKEKSERTKVEFVSGTKKTSQTSVPPITRPSGDSSGGKNDENKKRKSKWDVGASQSAIITPTVSKPLLANPPGIVPVSTAASRSKATVISAFGTITKKAKQ